MSTPFVTFKSSSENFNQLVKPKILEDGGFRVGNLYVLHGKAKVGKSTISEDVALNAAQKGAKVAYIDGDMQGFCFIRFNEMLMARKDEKGAIPPLPISIFNEPPSVVASTFKKHLTSHNFFLEIPRNKDEFIKSTKVLANKPHLVLCDSMTLFFRQDQLTSSSKYGRPVKTVETVSTKLRQYARGGDAQYYPPDGYACVVLTAQSKSELSETIRVTNMQEKVRQGIPIPTREKQLQRPFIGGEGYAYMGETFIEIIHDSTDPLGKRRIAEIWGSRNLIDRKTAFFQIVDRGVADTK